MATAEPTATAEATVQGDLTEAQIPGEFWEAMNLVEPKFREAWIIGSRAFLSPADKARVVRKLNYVIAQLEYARDLMS